MKSIDVVAGIIFSEDRQSLLLGFRSARQHQGNLWEFPGGKVEAGETFDNALVRELEEEVGIVATDISLYQTISHDYGDKSVVLHFYCVNGFTGQPQSLENQSVTWVPVEQLGTLEFPAANQPVVDALLATGGRLNSV